MQVKKAQKRLLLDEETAAKFAPLYKEYLEAMKECKPAPKQLQKGEKKELTDAEIDQMMLCCSQKTCGNSGNLLQEV